VIGDIESNTLDGEQIDVQATGLTDPSSLSTTKSRRVRPPISSTSGELPQQSPSPSRHTRSAVKVITVPTVNAHQLSRTRNKFSVINETGIHILLTAECVDKVDEWGKIRSHLDHPIRHTYSRVPCQPQSNFCLEDGETRQEHL